jgi:hypothetical protein
MYLTCDQCWLVGWVLQETLELFFNNSKGQECIFTWRAIGAGLVTLLPAMTYTLRVSIKL